ncbi:unnamed protein product [Musa hybrid cultivar]
MGPASRITRVQIYAGLIVDSIKVWYVFHLRKGEYINCISGHVKDFRGTRCVSQLTFVTNMRKTHGPFGQGGGVAFSVLVAEGRIIGFYGNAETYLNALGIYLKPN